MSTQAGVCVLVVDDDPLMRRRLGRVLGQAGFEVWLAESAEAALVCLAQRDFDLLLTDLQLPGLDGQELTRVACQRQPLLRVAWLSGAPLAHPERMLLAKPFSHEALRVFVAAALRQEPALTGALRPAAAAAR